MFPVPLDTPFIQLNMIWFDWIIFPRSLENCSTRQSSHLVKKWEVLYCFQMWYEVILAYAVITAAIAAFHGITYLHTVHAVFKRHQNMSWCLQSYRTWLHTYRRWKVQGGLRGSWRIRLHCLYRRKWTGDIQETKTKSEQTAGQTLKKCLKQKKA